MSFTVYLSGEIHTLFAKAQRSPNLRRIHEFYRLPVRRDSHRLA